MKKLLPTLLAVLLSVPLSIVALRLLGSPAARAPERAGGQAAGAETLGGELAALEARLLRLEAALDALATRPLLSPREVAAERVPARSPDDGYAALVERLGQIESELARVREVPVETAATPEQVAHAEAERRRKRELAIAEAKLTVGDPAATVEAKLEAHAALRRVPDAYTPEMVADLVQLGLTALEPEQRAEVWRNFDGASHLPVLVPHLRTALANDRDPRARDEAAETLGNYLDDAGALEALRWSAEHDESPRVRQKALRTLNSWSLLLAERDGR